MEGGCFQNQVFLLVEQWWVPINILIIILIIIILIGGRVESLNNLKCEQFMAMFRSSLPIIVRQYPLNHAKLSFFTASGWCFGFLSWSCRIWCQREPIRNARLCLFFTFQNLFSQHFAFLATFTKRSLLTGCSGFPWKLVQVFLENLTACSGFPWWNCNSGNPPHIPMAPPSWNKCCLKTLETEWGV